MCIRDRCREGPRMPGRRDLRPISRHNPADRAQIAKSTTSQPSLCRRRVRCALCRPIGRCGGSLSPVTGELPLCAEPTALLIRWSLVRVQHGSPYKNPCFGGGFCLSEVGCAGAIEGGFGPDAHEKLTHGVCGPCAVPTVGA